MKPLIGVNLDVTEGPPREVRLQAYYFEAVTRAGGIPVLLPPMSDEDLEEVWQTLNGVMLIGGLDYSPLRYASYQSATVEVAHPLREDFDFRLALRTQTSKMPVLGICAGLQLLNVSMGGSLIQDIKEELGHTDVNHASKNGWIDGFTRHDVIITENSRLHKIYGAERISVPTSHHQAIKSVAESLTVTAHADDGVIEAFECNEKPFFIGVQWHPERDFDGNKPLFEAFVRSAATVGANR